jgi:predicted chitinase
MNKSTENTMQDRMIHLASPSKTAEIEKYVRHPEDIAEKLDGGRLGNGVGTGDAWRFRPRGLAYVRGRNDYQKVADSLHIREIMDNPDLMLIPEINALSFFYFYFKTGSVPALAAAAGGEDWKAALAAPLRRQGFRRDHSTRPGPSAHASPMGA